MEGSVRLVPLKGESLPTSSCDAVHLGGVELFREGRWGRVCAGRSGRAGELFTLGAQVICRQLGFPFGTVMDQDEPYYNVEYDTGEAELVWAQRVRRMRKEKDRDGMHNAV